MQQKSRCIHCGSPDIGKGCRYGPHGVHFHPNDSTKCAYCGSSSFGRGCKINPTSDLHVHGINFNSMIKESTQSFLNETLLMHEIKKDYKDFLCYKLGIIDEKGNKLKVPVTEQERASFSPFVRTILRIKKHLGSKIQLIETCDELNKTVNAMSETVEARSKIIGYQARVDSTINELFKILDEASADGLSAELVNSLIKA